MLLMLRVGDGINELSVAPDSTNVFWWAISFAFDAQWISTAVCDSEASLKLHLMLPAVSEVVLVEETKSLAILGDDLADLGDGRIDTLEVLKAVIE